MSLNRRLMNSFNSPFLKSSESVASFPSQCTWAVLETIVLLWFPQTEKFFICAGCFLRLRAISEIPLLKSRRVRAVMFSFGIDGAYLLKMYAFVLAGLATTTTLTVFLA